MAVGLFLVALAMIAGGGYAAVEGYGIILNERGWSMLIAGAVVATGGVLLLGASVIAGRLRRVVKELTLLRERVGRLDEAAPAPGGGEATAQTRLDPDVPGAVAGEDALGQMSAAAAAARAGLSRRGATSPRVVGGPVDEPVEHAVARNAEVIPEPARESQRPGAGGSTPVAANDGAPAGDDAAVVGTYNSGGNAYVMYSDGSIEADTPGGRYRFRSLEELKDFIANGGEDGVGATRAP